MLPREDQEAICGPEFAMGGRKKRERESNLCSSRKLEGNQGGREVDITKSQINLLSCPKCGRNAVLWEGRSFLPWRNFTIP